MRAIPAPTAVHSATSRPALRRLAVLGAVGALILSTAAAATAVPHGVTAAVVLPGYQPVTTTGTLPAGATVQAQVLCPPGKVATGGGASVRRANGLLSGFVQESFPVRSATRGGWRVTLTSTEQVSRTFVLRTLCLAPPPGYEIRGARFDLAPGATARATVRCSPGKKVLSGGIDLLGEVADGLDARWRLTVPAADTGWTIGAGAGSAPRTVRAVAACADPIRGYQVIDEGNEVNPDNLGGLVLGGWNCPPGWKLLGGGYDFGVASGAWTTMEIQAAIARVGVPSGFYVEGMSPLTSPVPVVSRLTCVL